MPLAPGETIAGYTVVRQLGSGGMGAVYLVRHPRLPRMDALKLLKPEFSADPDFSRRFLREADVVAGLSHRNIVAVLDRGEDRGQLWLTMQYIEGIDAEQALEAAGGILPADRVAHIVTEVAAALDAAHRHHLIHRDVKPANILLSPSSDDDDEPEQVFLTDFGIAKSLQSGSTRLTRTGAVLATFDYASPEQIESRSPDARSDIYSLACVLYKLLTGSVPFPGPGVAAAIHGHLQLPPPRPTKLVPWLAPRIDDVIVRAMDKDPAERLPDLPRLRRRGRRGARRLPRAPGSALHGAAHGADRCPAGPHDHRAAVEPGDRAARRPGAPDPLLRPAGEPARGGRAHDHGTPAARRPARHAGDPGGPVGPSRGGRPGRGAPSGDARRPRRGRREAATPARSGPRARDPAQRPALRAGRDRGARGPALAADVRPATSGHRGRGLRGAAEDQHATRPPAGPAAVLGAGVPAARVLVRPDHARRAADRSTARPPRRPVRPRRARSTPARRPPGPRFRAQPAEKKRRGALLAVVVVVVLLAAAGVLIWLLTRADEDPAGGGDGSGSSSGAARPRRPAGRPHRPRPPTRTSPGHGPARRDARDPAPGRRQRGPVPGRRGHRGDGCAADHGSASDELGPIIAPDRRHRPLRPEDRPPCDETVGRSRPTAAGDRPLFAHRRGGLRRARPAGLEPGPADRAGDRLQRRPGGRGPARGRPRRRRRPHPGDRVPPGSTTSRSPPTGRRWPTGPARADAGAGDIYIQRGRRLGGAAAADRRRGATTTSSGRRTGRLAFARGQGSQAGGRSSSMDADGSDVSRTDLRGSRTRDRCGRPTAR